jgi:dienelactone hydrolase
VYRLKTLSKEPASISEVIDVSSLDDASGKAFVTLSYLRPAQGSLETLGSVQDSTSTYLPRIDRWFELMGRPKNVVVMGYSRGAIVALDLVAKAALKPEAHPFVRNVKAVTSLAGVLYGSQLADAAGQQGNPTGDVIHEMADLAAHLHSCDSRLSLVDGAKNRSENTARWVGTTAKVSYLLSKLPKHAQMDLELIETASADLGRVAQMAKRVAFDEVLRLDKPVSDYCGNVLRFKQIVQQVVSGANSLSTSDRLNWWRTNIIPANVQLVALTATMVDGTSAGTPPSALLRDPVVYDGRSMDFKSLRASFYDLYAASGTDLNDSQVSLGRARFYPELFSVMNPAQPKLHSTFLGTVGSHHWGLAFPRAIPTRDGLSGNPFPRTVLLRAIATSISRSIAAP